MKRLKGRTIGVLKCLAVGGAMLASSSAWAGFYNDGKVFLTGGVMTVDGAGGGGAVPWATITGYETRDGINGGVGFTYVNLPNYTLNFFGGAVGFYDRFELSVMNTKLTTNLSNVNTVGLIATAAGIDEELGLDAHGSQLHMMTYGAKLRLFGDAVYTSDSWLPQTAVGILYKDNSTKEFVRTLNGADNKDYEVYLAFTKVLFPLSTLVNVTARYTSANQIGLTGFGTCDGSDCKNDKEVRWELSVAHLLAKNFAIGFEYQQHGDDIKGKSVSLDGVGLPIDITPLVGAVPGLNASLAQSESDWYDFFFAYAPNKHYSITMAYLMLGDIAVATNQNGFYISLHATF